VSRLLAAQRALTVPGWVKDELWRRARAVPSLDLRFADSKSLVDATTGQNLVTFTRASGATYVDSQGVIRPAVTNLLLQSEDFSTTWANVDCTITTNSATAPSGQNSADKVIPDVGVALGYVSQSMAVTAGVPYVLSVYAKPDGMTELRFVLLATTFGVLSTARCDLSTGSIISTSGAITAASIIPVGGGWFRVTCTALPTTTGSSANRIQVTGATGDGTSGIYIWGAQLEQSSTVGEYVPTGATINSAPRFDHNPVTGESLGLLIEEQRSNLLLNSGTLATQNVTVTAVAHTLSFTGTGTVTLSGTSTAGPLVGTGTGEANRVSLTFTPTAGTLTLTVSGTVTNAQLEIGAFRTSYIPTAGTAATRSADVCSISGSNFSGWYRQDEGSFFADAIHTAAPIGGAARRMFEVNNASEAERLFAGFNTTTAVQMLIQDDNVIQANLTLTVPAPISTVKLAVAFALNNAGIVANGGAVSSDASCTTPTPTQLTIGYSSSGGNSTLNGHIRRLTYWPARLPNSMLQTITQ
jgi:hypothetical protein